MNKKIFVICLILIAIFMSFNMVSAGNFTDLKNNIDDNDFINLNEDFILNQNTSDEDIVFKRGIEINDKEIYIEGNNHIISGRDLDGNQVRLFNIADSKVTLANMIITSASVNGSGGAIYLPHGSDLILINVTFRDNSALGIYGEGGAIYARGHIYIYNCTFENNFASGAAGAVYARSTSYIEGTDFVNNTAKWYGGGVLSSYLMNIFSCSFINNNAYSGSAFHYTVDYDDENAYINFYGCNFINNEANDGTVSTSSFRNITFNECNFIGNHANRGGVFYKSSLAKTFISSCLFENNSAEIGAIFYESSFEGNMDYFFGFLAIYDSYLKNNYASDKASVFYGKSSNFWANNTIFYNNTNNAIYNGKGNLTVMNSKISNYGSEFITQFLGGNIVLLNNTWGVSNPDYGKILKFSEGTKIYDEKNYTKTAIDLNMDSIKHAAYNDTLDCCSIYVRINQTDFAIAHRRDGGNYNYTQFIDQNEDYIKYFKPSAEYFFFTKVYKNGWVIGTGGWDDAVFNEKIEAIASDMVKNEYIDPDALQLIFSLKRSIGCGHFLIVAPNGTYGNAIYYNNNINKSFYEIGVLHDNEFIVSPNGPDYRRQDYLDNLTNPVDACIYLAAVDGYGFNRHCIVVHHISLNENGFSDDVYASNEDGRFINQSNGQYADKFWFKEQFFNDDEIPIALDKLYLGTYYFLNNTILSQNLTRGYNSDYNYSAQFFNQYGELLINEDVTVSVNGKTMGYVTNDNGLITIPFIKLASSQNIVLTNPVTGEVAKNTIKVVPRLIGSNVVMDYFDGSKYTVKVYGTTGKVLGKDYIVTVKLNKKTYKIKTNSKGIATLTIPKTLTPKTYTLTATFAGQTIKNTIKVKQILKTADKVVKKSSKKLILKATLKSSKNKAIKGKWISFKLNGKTYKAKTNYKGIAQVTINKIAVSKLKVGKTYTLKAVYLKDSVKASIKVKR